MFSIIFPLWQYDFNQFCTEERTKSVALRPENAEGEVDTSYTSWQR
jgi:hypothetical protein